MTGNGFLRMSFFMTDEADESMPVSSFSSFLLREQGYQVLVPSVRPSMGCFYESGG